MSVHPRIELRSSRGTGLSIAGRAYQSSPFVAVAGLSGIEGNPVPPRPRVRLVASDAVSLRTVTWLPQGRPRGTVLLLQGRGDFIEKYFEVVSDLLVRGFVAVTFDWRGQGGSQRLLADRLKGHVDDFTDYRTDLDSVVRQVLPSLPRPWVGLAHSMGAAVLLQTLADDDGWLDRAVLTAPMVALSPALAPRGARSLAYLLDGMGLGTSFVPGPVRRGLATPAFAPDNLLTSDPVRYLRSYQILSAAPYLAVGKPTIGWLRAAFDAMEVIRAAPPRGAHAPLLVVAGDKDRVTDTSTAMTLAGSLPAASGVLLEGAAHDVLMERDALRERFWAAFDAFTAVRHRPVVSGRQ